MKKNILKKDSEKKIDTIVVDELSGIGSLGIITSGNIPHLSKDKVIFDGDTIVVDDFTPEKEINFPKQEKSTEWEIVTDVYIDPDKKRQAMEYLKNGLGTRKVSIFLGLLPQNIVRKK